jgi:hypothetical protein
MGTSAAAGGIALPDRRTLGQWFVVTDPNGREHVVQQTDLGPAKWTGRGIDITGRTANDWGYKPGNFPTNGRFSHRPATPDEIKSHTPAGAAKPADAATSTTPSSAPTTSLEGLPHVAGGSDDVFSKFVSEHPGNVGDEDSMVKRALRAGAGPISRALAPMEIRKMREENEERAKRISPGSGGTRGEAETNRALAMRKELEKPIHAPMHVEPPSQAARRSVSRRTMRQNREDEMRDARTHHTSDIGFA